MIRPSAGRCYSIAREVLAERILSTRSHGFYGVRWLGDVLDNNRRRGGAKPGERMKACSSPQARLAFHLRLR